MKQTDEHSPASHPAVRGRKKGGFTSYLATVLLNRWVIALINALACFVCTIAMIEVVSTIIAHTNQHGAEEIVTGIGVILIGYGVVLEERHSFRRLMGGVRGSTEEWESAVDDLCHGAGLLLLVFGLLAEIAVTCLDLPDRIVNTSGIERQVLSIGVLFVVASMITMAVHSIKMLMLRHASDPIP